MFREMRRYKQQLGRDECVRLLIKEPRGVLSMIGDDGYPYGIPMNHWYDEKTGTLCFHGARTGHKIDALTACPKAGYCVYDKGYTEDGDWALHIRSVVVFGHVRMVDDPARALEICASLCRKFSDDEAYLRKELERGLPRVQCLELVIDHMTGKLVKES